MMIRNLVLACFAASFTLIQPQNVLAQVSQRPAAQKDDSCKQTNDPFEVAYKFTSASEKHSGECIDSLRFRAIQNLKIENGVATFNNYQHQNEYWSAKLNLSAANVDQVLFQIVRFPIMSVVQAAHIQIRFKLKSDVELAHQLDGRKTKTSDVLISFEASRPKGVSYNFALGVMENYALIGKVASTEQKKLDGTDPFEQYELGLSPEEKSQLLQITLTRAFTTGNSSFYSTLRPNCATEVFDSIDTLPRFKGKIRNFLTVISNDPVAKPSIAALQTRGILKRRVQNFEDEVKGVIKDIPLATTAAQPLIPQVANNPWTLLVTLPRLDRLSPTEIAAILKIRSEILNSFPVLVQGLLSTYMKEAGDDTSKILNSVVANLQGRILTLLKSANAHLPNTAQSLAVYLIPYPSTSASATTSLQNLGIPAELPFSVKDVEIDDNDRSAVDTYYRISEGARKAGDVGATTKDPAYLMAAAVRLKLQRNANLFHSQLLVGINDQNRPFSMTNSQVAFKNAVLTGSKGRLSRPTVLISHSQTHQTNLNPIVNIEFGPEGGLAGKMNPDSFGIFQIRKQLDENCQAQAASSPTLIGNLGTAALNKPILDKLVAGKLVAFQILGADMNLSTRTVDKMDVRLSTWPLQCLSVQSVNHQFAREANQMILKLETESRSGQLMQNLIQKILAR